MLSRLAVKAVTYLALLFLATEASVPDLLRAADGAVAEYERVRKGIIGEFDGRKPFEWGDAVAGVKSALDTDELVIALTLDACGGPKGSGYDTELIRFLEREGIPATLFVNARWIDANSETFLRLARNPLFTIANHGFRHRPASVNGRGIYGINGTKSVGELTDEIWLNTEKIRLLTGTRTEYYRSGTAYYDEVAVQVAERLGHKVIGFNVIGDGGATFTKNQVRTALITSKPGSIVILHMNHPGKGIAEGFEAAVPILRSRGFRFVKLSDYPLKQAGGRK